MADDNYGEIKTYNADKYIAIERDLPLVIGLMKAFRQVRTGETPDKNLSDMTDKEKIFNKVSGLILVIHSLNALILLGWTKIETPCRRKWELSKMENKPKFEDEKNDFNDLMSYRELLDMCEQDIIKADLTKSVSDDFYLKKINSYGEEEYVLTKNYYNMRKILEEVWPKIEYLLYKYAVLSQGFIKDEDLSEKQKEEELKRRILNG